MANAGAAREFAKNPGNVGWVNGLTDTEREIVSRYTGFEYETYNKAARSDQFHPALQYLDRALDKAHLSQNVTAFRYISARHLAGKNVGDEFVDRGYVSTSLDPSYIHYRTGQRCEIRVPKGYQAAAVRNISRHQPEEELLLRRGTRFRVVQVGSPSAATILEVIP